MSAQFPVPVCIGCPRLLRPLSQTAHSVSQASVAANKIPNRGENNRTEPFIAAIILPRTFAAFLSEFPAHCTAVFHAH